MLWRHHGNIGRTTFVMQVSANSESARPRHMSERSRARACRPGGLRRMISGAEVGQPFHRRRIQLEHLRSSSPRAARASQEAAGQDVAEAVQGRRLGQRRVSGGPFQAASTLLRLWVCCCCPLDARPQANASRAWVPFVVNRPLFAGSK